MTALLAICILLAPSAPQTEIGEPLVVVNSDGAPPSAEAGSLADPRGRSAVGGAQLPDTATAVEGTATWLCDPPKYPRCTRGYPEGSMVAARGSEIPASWRGRWVRVTDRDGDFVVVRIVDACQCKAERVIDLYAVAFRKLEPTWRGEIYVTVQLASAPRVTLPQTSTEN
jgi:hypothetical protein